MLCLQGGAEFGPGSREMDTDLLRRAQGGLVEQRGEALDVGLEALRAALEELRLPPEAVADHILETLGRSEGAPDDVALLVLSHLPED